MSPFCNLNKIKITLNIIDLWAQMHFHIHHSTSSSLAQARTKNLSHENLAIPQNISSVKKVKFTILSPSLVLLNGFQIAST